ncbi:MAG: hypothetical protein H7Z40_15735 [Phycisphaerae bacterium]|nr:hypothetical protein [Gemmatimonadaceae bacterium]
MSDTIQFFRTNTGAMVITMLLGIGTLVFGLLGLMMLRAGVSLKPIVFLAGFFGIIVLPQAALHLSQALGWIPKKELVWTPGGHPTQWSAREDRLTIRDGRFAEPTVVFGPEVDTDLVSDLRVGLPDIFGKSEAAEMAVLRTTATVVLAQFDDAATAAEGLRKYAAAMVGVLPALEADGTYTMQRGNDVVKLLLAGRTVLAFSAANAATLQNMVEGSPIVQQVDPATLKNEPEFWLYRWPVLVTMLIVLVGAATVWFFRMSAWASEVPAAKDSVPAESGVLRERLLAINKLDVPFTITPSDDDANALIVTWRYADAKWMDMARVHGMRRTHRIILNLDGDDATVRPTEQMTSMDWSASAGGLRGRWVTSRGITFFQYEYERVFGLQFDSAFQFRPSLSYTYTFNLQEMKAPLIQAVTQSGWRWRPVMLHGPKWLSWLIN